MTKSRNLTADTVLCSRLWRILDLISFIITFNYYRFYTVDQEGKRSYFSDEPEVYIIDTRYLDICVVLAPIKLIASDTMWVCG